MTALLILGIFFGGMCLMGISFLMGVLVGIIIKDLFFT